MKKTFRHQQQGFTLIEVILYVALLAIVLSGMVRVSWDLMAGRVKAKTQQELNHQLRFAATRIGYEIRNASAINSVSGTSISLAQTDAARNPTIIDLSAGRLRIGWGAGGPCPTASPCFLTSDDVSISGVSFTNFTSGASEHIKFQFVGTTTGATSEFQATQSIEGSAELLTD